MYIQVPVAVLPMSLNEAPTAMMTTDEEHTLLLDFEDLSSLSCWILKKSLVLQDNEEERARGRGSGRVCACEESEQSEKERK